MKLIYSSMLFLFVLTHNLLSQTMQVKDETSNILMKVNDEGSVGSITLPSGSEPGTTLGKIYNENNALAFSGYRLVSFIGEAVQTSQILISASSTWHDIPGVSLSFTLESDRTLHLRASGSVKAGNDDGTAYFRFVINGVDMSAGESSGNQMIGVKNGWYTNWYMEGVYDVSAGAQTVKVQMKAGSAEIKQYQYSGYQAKLYVETY